MFSFLSSIGLAAPVSSTSSSELNQESDLKEVLEGLDTLLNDDFGGIDHNLAILDVLGAEKILANGSSAFHKTGLATVSFLRALIGFETDIMKEGIHYKQRF
jgi:Protein of unknown function (DUF3808)